MPLKKMLYYVSHLKNYPILKNNHLYESKHHVKANLKKKHYFDKRECKHIETKRIIVI